MKLARIALPTLIAVLGSGATIFLFRNDCLFFLESREPRDLGEVSAPLQARGNAHVRVRGVVDLTRSLRVGRKDGDVRVARLGMSDLLVQVPVVGPPGAPPDGRGGLQDSGLFDGRGRLWAVADLPGAYLPILRRFEAPHFQEGGPVRYLLVADESPSDAWLGFAATVSVGLFGLLTLIFAARALARAHASARSANHDDVKTDRAAQE